ncbi:hypothetical protein BGX27_002576 [Mortierella sp. AM989]|nr:hypothetical protein BGX27_002576 [Mortierella sp. AM989]
MNFVALTWERMVAGFLAIAIGMPLTVRGFRHYRFTIFIHGFLGGALIVYSIFLNVEPDGGWDKRQIIYVFSSIAGGLVLGTICFIFHRYSMWTVSGLAGFCIAMYILGWKTDTLIHKKGGRIALLVASTVVGMIFGLFIGRRLIIPCSSIVGAYVTILGVDFFARTGFLENFAYSLKTDPKAFYRITTNVYVMLGVLAGFAILGMVIQTLAWKKHRRSLVAKGRTIHEFDNDWSFLRMKGQPVRPDPTYSSGGYGVTSNARNDVVYNEKKPWNPFQKRWNPFKKSTTGTRQTSTIHDINADNRVSYSSNTALNQ